MPKQKEGKPNRYDAIILRLFEDNYREGITYYAEKFPNLICRAVSAQFMTEDRIAMFELVLQDNEIRVAEEKHYRLVPSSAISIEDLRNYAL